MLSPAARRAFTAPDQVSETKLKQARKRTKRTASHVYHPLHPDFMWETTCEVRKFLEERAEIMAGMSGAREERLRAADRYFGQFYQQAKSYHMGLPKPVSDPANEPGEASGGAPVSGHRRRPSTKSDFFEIKMAQSLRLRARGAFAACRYLPGQYVYKPEDIMVLRAWGPENPSPGVWRPRSILFATQVVINGCSDSYTMIFLYRFEGAPWMVLREVFLDCHPKSRAWRVGKRPLSLDDAAIDLPGLGNERTGLDKADLAFIEEQNQLLQPGGFRRGAVRHFNSFEKMVKALKGGEAIHDYLQHNVLDWLDDCFTGLR